MRTAISELDLRRASTADDALRILAAEERTPIAGATDLYVALNFGTLDGRRFLDISRVAELREIALVDGSLRIGALATYTAIVRSPLVRERLPMLVDAALQIGGVQIQNRGTLGGNIANASPAGDSLPVLAAADAVVVLRHAGGERRVAINEFYTGYRRSVMQRNELIVAIEIPPIDGAQWFRKVGTRAAQAISKVVMAAVRSATPRIALGSVAPTVVRMRRTESALAGGATIEEAQRVLAAEIQPIDDLRSTAAYRRQVAVNLLRRFWSDTA